MTEHEKWTAYAGLDRHIIEKLAGSTLTEEEIATIVAETRAEIKAREVEKKQREEDLESARENFVKSAISYIRMLAENNNLEDIDISEKDVSEMLHQLEKNFKNDIKLIKFFL